MVKDYVFWGLFALVLVGIGISLWDRRRRSLKAKELEEAYRAGLVAAAQRKPDVGPAAKHAAKPAADAPGVAFDPNATRIHFRGPSADPATAAPLHRDVAPLPPEATPRLVCVGGGQKDHSFPITPGGISIGRDPKNDVVISDPRASYHHAWIGIIHHKAVLRDLGSTNGTFLNAQIKTPVTEVVLNPGDTIFFGGHGRDQFRFVVN